MSGFGGRGGGGAPRVRKVMTQAINLIFEFLKNVSAMRPASLLARSVDHLYLFRFREKNFIAT